jgi:hypothetical protein
MAPLVPALPIGPLVRALVSSHARASGVSVCKRIDGAESEGVNLNVECERWRMRVDE